MAIGILHSIYLYTSDLSFSLTMSFDYGDIIDVPVTGTKSVGEHFLPSQTETGVKVRDVDYTLYSRMHIALPDEDNNREVIRNILAGDESVDLLIWNAYRKSDQTINNYIFDSSVDGVSIGTISPVETLSPLNHITGEYLLSIVGSFTVDGYITWDTSSNDLLTYFNFIRGLVSTFLPKYRTYKESEVYTTNIFVSGNNTEKRIALQDTHKYMMDYKVQATPKEDIQALSNLTRLNVERSVLHPVWSSSAIITDVTGAVVTCDTTYKDFSNYLLLFNDNDNHEIVTLSSKNDSSITLTNTPAGSFGSGDLIIPLKACTIDKRVKSNLVSLNNMVFDIKVEELYLEISYNGTPDAYPTYLTYDVLNNRPEFVPSYTHFNDYQILGKMYNTRVKYRYSEQEELMDYDYFFKSESEIYNFRNFFRDQKGRFNKFWLPSWKADFTVQVGASSGATTITVSGLNVKFQTHLTRHVFIAPDFYAKVDSYTLVDNDTVTLNLSESITSNLFVGDVISNLYLVRFDQDELTINYDNIDFTNAKVRVGFKELQPETP